MAGLGKGGKKKVRAITGGKTNPAGKNVDTKRPGTKKKLTEPHTRKIFNLPDSQIERLEDYLHAQKKQGNKTDMTKVVRAILEKFLVEEGF